MAKGLWTTKAAKRETTKTAKGYCENRERGFGLFRGFHRFSVCRPLRGFRDPNALYAPSDFSRFAVGQSSSLPPVVVFTKRRTFSGFSPKLTSKQSLCSALVT